MDIYLKNLNISLEEAISKASANDIIYLADKIYFEKIVVDKPNITIIGSNNSGICFNDCHSTIIRGGDGRKTYGTTGSASFTVKPTGDGFKAYNVSFINSYKRTKEQHGQAVAFKSECSNILLDNCRFIGHQDTLYVDFGKNNIIKNSYIEGDVDFIFGSADCIFEKCIIKAINNERNIAYYTAPDTFISNKQGFIFEDCEFIADEDMELYLGRPWFPSKSKEKVYPRIEFKNCLINKNTNLFLKQMHEADPKDFVLKIIDCKLV